MMETIEMKNVEFGDVIDVGTEKTDRLILVIEVDAKNGEVRGCPTFTEPFEGSMELTADGHAVYVDGSERSVVHYPDPNPKKLGSLGEVESKRFRSFATATTALSTSSSSESGKPATGISSRFPSRNDFLRKVERPPFGGLFLLPEIPSFLATKRAVVSHGPFLVFVFFFASAHPVFRIAS